MVSVDLSELGNCVVLANADQIFVEPCGRWSQRCIFYTHAAFTEAVTSHQGRF